MRTTGTDKNGLTWTRIQLVSCFPVLEQIRTTDKNGWTCIQKVSPSVLQIWTTKNGVYLECNLPDSSGYCTFIDLISGIWFGFFSKCPLQSQWFCPIFNIVNKVKHLFGLPHFYWSAESHLACMTYLFIILSLIPTALLICTENAFWDISGDWNFVELFKKSFISYVESGMREKVEIDIEILRNEQGEFSVTKDFKEKFYEFIVDHYLCKFHCFICTQLI